MSELPRPPVAAWTKGSVPSEGRIWEVSSGKPLGRTSHKGSVTAAAFSADAKLLLTASANSAVQLWDGTTGAPLGPALKHFGVQTVAISPDYNVLLTGNRDGTIRLWEARTGKPISARLQHGAGIWKVSFSPDGRMARSEGAGRVRLWEAATGKEAGQIVPPWGTRRILAFSPDDRLLLAEQPNSTLRLYDAVTGKPLGLVSGHRVVPMSAGVIGADFVLTAAFSPDGSVLATGGADQTARLWEAATGKPLAPALQHKAPVDRVLFSPDGRTLLTASRDQTAKLWETATGKPRGAPLPIHGNLRAASFGGDGKSVLIESFAFGLGEARLWEARTGRPLGPPLKQPEVFWAHSGCFSPDGKLLLTCGSGGTWSGGPTQGQLWDTTTGQRVGRPLEGLAGPGVFSLEGKTLLSANGAWDVITGKRLGKPFPRPADAPFLWSAFSPDRKSLLLSSSPNEARLWDTSTGKPLGAPLRCEAMGAAFSADGGLLLTKLPAPTERELATAAVINWGSVQLWDTRTSQALGPPFEHAEMVVALAFSPDGRAFAAGHGGSGAREGEALLRKVPTPLEGTPERIVLWIQIATGKELDREGVVRTLDAAEQQQRRRRLRELGGPPGL